MEFKIKSLIIFLIMFSINVFAQKMPGEYIKSINELNVFNDIGLRIQPKSGYSEHYFIDSVSSGPMDLTFSVYDYIDEKNNVATNQWFELIMETGTLGKYCVKILTEKGLFQGELLKIQFKLREYVPFELPLNDSTNKQFIKKHVFDMKEKSKAKAIFVKNDKLRLDGKEYNVKIYKAVVDSETVEYALLEEKDIRLFGIGYFKSKEFKMYLKNSSENSVSVFPSKVPLLDAITNIYKMNVQFLKQEEEKEKALVEEKKLEEDLPDDDPINKLNNILKKNE